MRKKNSAMSFFCWCWIGTEQKVFLVQQIWCEPTLASQTVQGAQHQDSWFRDTSWTSGTEPYTDPCCVANGKWLTWSKISPNYVVFYCICCEQGTPVGQGENCGRPALGCSAEPLGYSYNSQKSGNSLGFWELCVIARSILSPPERFVISGNAAFSQGSF